MYGHAGENILLPTGKALVSDATSDRLNLEMSNGMLLGILMRR